MKLIKFSTKLLTDFDVRKEYNKVIITLFYSDIEKPIILTETMDVSKIHHWDFNRIGTVGWVTFYELSEVFHITDSEKQSILKQKTQPKDKSESSSDRNINLSDVESDDTDFDDLFKNF